MLFNYKEHRIFAFSDTHGMHKWLHIPEKADILLCAGDVVSGFGKDGMADFFVWLLSHPAKLYIFVAGNHELFLEASRGRFLGRFLRRMLLCQRILLGIDRQG